MITFHLIILYYTIL